VKKRVLIVNVEEPVVPFSVLPWCCHGERHPSADHVYSRSRSPEGPRASFIARRCIENKSLFVSVVYGSMNPVQRSYERSAESNIHGRSSLPSQRHTKMYPGSQKPRGDEAALRQGRVELTFYHLLESVLTDEHPRVYCSVLQCTSAPASACRPPPVPSRPQSPLQA
jgi:hypothetical protein